MRLPHLLQPARRMLQVARRGARGKQAHSAVLTELRHGAQGLRGLRGPPAGRPPPPRRLSQTPQAEGSGKTGISQQPSERRVRLPERKLAGQRGRVELRVLPPRPARQDGGVGRAHLAARPGLATPAGRRARAGTPGGAGETCSAFRSAARRAGRPRHHSLHRLRLHRRGAPVSRGVRVRHYRNYMCVYCIATIETRT